MTIPHVITPMRDHDHSLVLNSWLESYRKAPSSHRLPSGVYYTRMRRTAERLLSHSDVKIARPPDWPEGVLGWLCAEQCEGVFVLHYGFVKAFYRRNGLGKALVDAFDPRGRKVFTHLRPPYTDHLRNLGFSHAPHYASVKFGGTHG
jgi:hypothetical protein